MAESPVTRNELAILFKAVDERFALVFKALETAAATARRETEMVAASSKEALSIASHEAEKKNIELNDVRHRFIPREVYDAHREEQEKKFEAYKIEQARVRVTAIRALVSVGFGVIALGFTLLTMLLRR
jgi:hypothetical protein